MTMTMKMKMKNGMSLCIVANCRWIATGLHLDVQNASATRAFGACFKAADRDGR